MPGTVAEELRQSSFKGIPTFFPTMFKGNRVGRAGVMICGDSISPMLIREARARVNDALIADAAD